MVRNVYVMLHPLHGSPTTPKRMQSRLGLHNKAKGVYPSMKKILALVVVLVLSLTCVAFADAVSTNARVNWRDEDLTKYADMTVKVGYAPATMNNPFWLAVMDGLQEAADKAGADVEIIPVSGDADQALINEGVNNLIADGIDVLVIAPADVAAAESAFKAAVDAGIPVVNFDTPVDEGDNGGYGDLANTIIASDNYNAGYVCGADVAAKFEGQHIKILVAHSPRATSCTRRYAGFFGALDELGADYEIVQEVDGWGDREKSLNAVAPALIADPDIDVIFAINDPSALGCYDAVSQTTVELEKAIKIYGVDGNPDIKVAIKNGTIEGTGSQSPNTLGFDSMVAAFKILSGEEVEHKIDVDTFLITAENVDEFGTDGWQ